VNVHAATLPQPLDAPDTTYPNPTMRLNNEANAAEAWRTSDSTDTWEHRTSAPSRFFPQYDFRPAPRSTAPKLRWGAGLRAQTVFTDTAWLEMGADAIVYPWKHLGLGVTAVQGVGVGASGCETALGSNCGAHWRAVTPTVEFRAWPDFWVSPYFRGSLGVAWGDFSYFRTLPGSTALASRSELGIDLHYGASLRLYLAAERFDGAHVDQGGIGGGLQLGLSL